MQPVVEHFGKWLLAPDGEINRSKLGGLVFRDAAALADLESIVHPLVRKAVDVLVKRASQPVVVIEAIKLLEGDLRKACDTIWVTYAPQVVQIERLTRKRKPEPRGGPGAHQCAGAANRKDRGCRMS